jgi:aryl-alcohol dehydrogenase-like predicted oxidoreductase
MNQKELGETGVLLPEIGLGTWLNVAIPQWCGNDQANDCF